MLELTVVEPARSAPAEPFSDNAIFWCAEAKPLPAANPGDDDVQEVAIAHGTADELRLVFDAAEVELAERVAGVCNSLYVTSGLPGIGEFTAAITISGWNAAGGMPAPKPASAIPEVRGEQTYVNAAATPKRHALKAAVEAWLERLAVNSKRVIERVGVIALQHANTRLDRSLQLTLQQSLRYFKNDGPRGAADSGQLVRGDAVLAGPDVASLADAIAQIAAMRREVELFQQSSDAAKTAVRHVGLRDSQTGLVGKRLSDASIRQDLRGLLDVPNAGDALARATQGFDAATRVLAQACAEQCRLHPVLQRLWDQPVVFAIADLWNNTPGAQRLAALQGDRRLAAALSSVLNDTTSAAHAFTAELRANPGEIWKYQRAIEASLQSLHLNEGDIAWRIVEDHLEKQRGSWTTLAELNMSLGLVEMMAAFYAVAPPVTVAIAVLSAGAAIAELVETAMEEARKDRAFQACLDPGESLALEGGSYIGVVVSALFIVLQLRGVKQSALKAVRAAP